MEPFRHPGSPKQRTSGISLSFPRLSPSPGKITHVLLTRSPLDYPPESGRLARLACVKHATSVRPEPGSNSPTRKEKPSKKTSPTPQPMHQHPKKTPAHPSNAEPNKHTPKNRAHKHSHRHAVEFSKNTPTPAPSTQPGHQKGINQTVTTKLTEPHSPTTTGGPPKRTPPAEPTDPTTQFNSPTPQPTTTTTGRSQRKPTLNHAEKPNPTGGPKQTSHTTALAHHNRHAQS